MRRGEVVAATLCVALLMSLSAGCYRTELYRAASDEVDAPSADMPAGALDMPPDAPDPQDSARDCVPLEDLSALNEADVFRSVGHGSFFSEGGAQTRDPTLAQILYSQAYYIEELRAQPGAERVDRMSVEAAHDDDVLANAAYIEALIEAVMPSNIAYLASLNGAMRGYYAQNLMGRPICP